MTTKKDENATSVKGFFRLQIVEDDKVVGDSGWCKNSIVNGGYDNFLCKALVGADTNGTITHMALGTGTAPNATDTALNGELTQNGTKRVAFGTTSVSQSKTLELNCIFNSTASFVGTGTQTAAIQNIGLFNSSSAGSLFAASTYSASTIATNQNVNATYKVIFS